MRNPAPFRRRALRAGLKMALPACALTAAVLASGCGGSSSQAFLNAQSMAALRSCIAAADGSATSDSPADGSAFLPDLADEQRSAGRGYFSAWYQGDPGTPNATHVDFLAFASATDAIQGVATMQASKSKLLKSNSSDPLSAVRHGNLVLLYSVSAATPAQTSKINACLREVNAGGSGVLTALTTQADITIAGTQASKQLSNSIQKANKASGGAVPANLQKLAACIAAAGSDTGKIQACNSQYQAAP
jgi:hypothetical protein